MRRLIIASCLLAATLSTSGCGIFRELISDHPYPDAKNPNDTAGWAITDFMNAKENSIRYSYVESAEYVKSEFVQAKQENRCTDYVFDEYMKRLVQAHEYLDQYCTQKYRPKYDDCMADGLVSLLYLRRNYDEEIEQDCGEKFSLTYDPYYPKSDDQFKTEIFMSYYNSLPKESIVKYKVPKPKNLEEWIQSSSAEYQKDHSVHMPTLHASLDKEEAFIAEEVSKYLPNAKILRVGITSRWESEYKKDPNSHNKIKTGYDILKAAIFIKAPNRDNDVLTLKQEIELRRTHQGSAIGPIQFMEVSDKMRKEMQDFSNPNYYSFIYPTEFRMKPDAERYEIELSDQTIKKADINKVDENGLTLLHKYARNGTTKDVMKLVDAGADVNAVDKDGKTPIFDVKQRDDSGNWVTDRDYESIIKVLYFAGADFAHFDKNGMTAVDYAISKGDRKAYWAMFEVTPELVTPKILFANMKNILLSSEYPNDDAKAKAISAQCDILRDLIQNVGVSPNGTDGNSCGMTYLMQTGELIAKSKTVSASSTRHFEKIVNLFIQKGVNVNEKSKEGATALSYIPKSESRVISAMKSAGAKEGKTPKCSFFK